MPENDDLLTLVDEDGVEHRFVMVEVVEVDDQSYAVLLPEDEDEEDEETEAYLFRIEPDDEDGESRLVAVEDDEEYDRVAAALAEMDDWEEDDEWEGPGSDD